jgi:cytochrome c-type biogenesis protein CcmH/NrfG
VLYYQINQYRDALDAYSRAIRLNPYLSEVWYDLGTLYESCNQISDSLDAYQRAAELDPANKHIQQRLNTLRAQLSGNGDIPYVSPPSPSV